MKQDKTLLPKIGRLLIVFLLKMFTDHGVSMLLNAQVEVAARVTYIICIAQITFKFIYNAWSVY